MTTTPTCSVSGCGAKPTQVFELDTPIRMTRMVCDFHNVALTSGEPYALRDGHKDLLMGADLGLEVIGFSYKETFKHHLLELKLGQSGVQTASVMMRLSPNMAKRICDSVVGHTHPEAFDSPDS